MRVIIPFALFITLLSFHPTVTYSQELSYARYDTKEGLAGSNVYCIENDKEGFLWFGTETGLSRFDGTNFVNFTGDDGLPDNEILQLFSDSKDRLWIAAFQKSICYYYRGEIHTQQNDSILSRIHLSGNVWNFAEDAHGNILINENYTLSILHLDGTTEKIKSLLGHPISNCIGISKSASGGFLILNGADLYEYNDGKAALLMSLEMPFINIQYARLSENMVVWKNGWETIRAISLKGDQYQIELPFPTRFIDFSIIDDSLFSINQKSGTTIYNLSGHEMPKSYLYGKSVSSVNKDIEGGYWFSTFGKGAYRLKSEYVYNIDLGSDIDNKPLGVTVLEKNGSEILAGTDLNFLYRFSGFPEIKPIGSRLLYYSEKIYPRIMALQILQSGDILYGSDMIIGRVTKSLKWIDVTAGIAVKAFAKKSPHEIIVATNKNVLIFNPKEFRIMDTIWNQRATSLLYQNDTIYIGTLTGLYRIAGDKTIRMGDLLPILNSRISGIKSTPGGVIWVSTYGKGIVSLKGDSIVKALSEKNGLTSNICRTIYTVGNNVWVGTDKGLNKINIDSGKFSITHYTIADGLSSNIINTILVDSNITFVGTTEGLTFFNEKEVSANSICKIEVTEFLVNGESFPLNTREVTLKPREKNIRISFAGISFRSAGEINYRYRLIGLDSVWRNSTEPFLSYPTLPSGSYNLQLQAINKFGVASKILSIHLNIRPLVWERLWFQILAALIVILITWWLVVLRIRLIRKREKEKNRINKRIADLEHLAWKAQMNPHFIFNSLNSIQHYVMDKDIAGANKFITGFSRLIRKTLEFSSKQLISADEEISYLSTYLELEKDRSENKFIYKIIKEPGLSLTDYEIPPLILQPFVENSVRHGIRYRKDNKGEITISIKKDQSGLQFAIHDNGVGRKGSEKFKSSLNIEYQSKGMTLIAERIEMINLNHEKKITLALEDLDDGSGNSRGTRVIVSFPQNKN